MSFILKNSQFFQKFSKLNFLYEHFRDFLEFLNENLRQIGPGVRTSKQINKQANKD